MPGPAIAAVGAGLAGSIYGARKQSQAIGDASDATAAATMAGIDEQSRQFDKMQALMEPYVRNGRQGFAQMLELGGMRGAAEQQKAIGRIERGSEFQTLLEQGEEAILANAAATGGLRGGNTQGALMEFRPQLLNSLIDKQYSRLSGLTEMGQNSAAGVGTNAMNMGNNVSSLLVNQGQSQAQAALSQGNVYAHMGNNIAGGIGQIAAAWKPGVPNGGLF